MKSWIFNKLHVFPLSVQIVIFWLKWREITTAYDFMEDPQNGPYWNMPVEHQ